MFEKPSDPRSGSYEDRTRVYRAIRAVDQLEQSDYAHMTAKELREIEWVLAEGAARAARQWKIRTEQSHE